MAVKVDEQGRVVSVDGKKSIEWFRLKMILSGLRFEVNCPGMRLTSKAPKCSTIVRRELGLKGRPEKLLEQLETMFVGVTDQQEIERA
jgi:hypothetical protein